jgi:hypothetical protein
MSDAARLFTILDDLIDHWCERRALRPLSIILRAYPPVPHLTDGWAELHAAVRDLKGLAPDELPEGEVVAVSEAHAVIHHILKASAAGAGIIAAAG